MTTVFKHIKHRSRKEAGAALVEFTLVLPLFLLLVFGMLDFGKAFNYWIDGTHLSHEGARWAAVSKNPGPGTTLADSVKSRADTPELKDGGGSVSSGLQVCVSFPNGTTKVGDPVRVTVTFTYSFLAFVAGETGIATKVVSNESTMRLERPPTYSAHCSA